MGMTCKDSTKKTQAGHVGVGIAVTRWPRPWPRPSGSCAAAAAAVSDAAFSLPRVLLQGEAAADDDSLPAACRAALTPPPTSLPRQYCRDVFPRKAPPPKDGLSCCTPVPNTVSEGSKSLLDRLKDLKAAANSLPAMCRAALTLPPPSLSQQYYRDVFPRKAPPPKDEPRRCSTVPKITSDGTKSLLDQLKDLKDSKKALQDRNTNLEKHKEMISKEVHDCMISNALFKVRLAGHMRLSRCYEVKGLLQCGVRNCKDPSKRRL
ncbi:uncharacterized protein LOC104581736 isoform X1 [Brachypodium distachyon]|uniref:uncharacterized protein LOC104581736 isoform X1 n=1 Tax=Brachypodium distachyon TaxID=15368 RepID=UPI000D0E0362|nr:uncharacterized protein LOC104581736 isoform X1 [Brachypodium distachyon]XP_024312418.1 uncharacterized protein LOC104581736 isoform X1 [Brachypodium distachyon]|eukprot:XP_024312417.1 uncharacterized protein LOC104581736 isoform X1 [Brachypodium distachyon]